MEDVKLTAINDDINGAEKGFINSFGFSVLIEIGKKKILFDVGTTPEHLIHNLKAYGLTPTSIDAIILSHNHYDHIDGIPGILAENKDVPVYIHKDWDIPGSFKGRSIPYINRTIVERARECKELISGLYITNSYLAGDYGGIHEQACFIKVKNSYILLTGCCHPGLLPFLEDRIELGIPQIAPIHLIGGMHNFSFNENDFKKFENIIQSVVLYHCTQNAKQFKKQFGEKCSIGVVGKTINY